MGVKIQIFNELPDLKSVYRKDAVLILNVFVLITFFIELQYLCHQEHLSRFSRSFCVKKVNFLFQKAQGAVWKLLGGH